MAFCALIHAFDKDIIAYDQLNPEFADKNLELAFSLAEEFMGIPRMFDPQDLQNADDKVLMTYLYEFPRAFLDKLNRLEQQKGGEEERRRKEEEERRRVEEAERRSLEEERRRANEEKRLMEEEQRRVEEAMRLSLEEEIK